MTTTFNHILVPTDFSDPAKHAREIAVMLARKLQAKVTLLNAYYVPALPLGNPFEWPMGEVSRIAREDMDKELAAAKQDYAQVDAIVRPGSPAEVIMSVARELPADLIVMGTHGRRGVSRFLLGSVAANVVRLSPIPVLTASEKTNA